MEKKEFRHVTVRLSYNSPEHMKIMGILDDLNPAASKMERTEPVYALPALPFIWTMARIQK